MSKYRKKPVVIEAIQWTGNNKGEIEDFAGDAAVWVRLGEFSIMRIETLEGIMTANKGDWVIKGIAGEYYPCHPNIFAATYELVEDEVLQ